MVRSRYRFGDVSFDVVFSKQAGRWAITELIARGRIDSRTLRNAPIAQWEMAANSIHTSSEAARPVGRPDGVNVEDYYRNVALRYAEIIRHTHAPAPVIAAEAGVPVSSVHRWIREARERGYLPPARPGRVG